ncbi:MAG: hypothetical protein A2297_03965 [Elusimicrobia bacterium RIFOXYB2_FULL_48_7]|nr:MAG: hypothetical protein A2297_03965 [Elusimicrobia bacterium RIFOXYB2_FULL_48_7]
MPDKRVKNIEDALDESISRLKAGKTIRECLETYPEYAEELAPLLVTAEKLNSMPAEMPHNCNLAQAIEKVRETAGRIGTTRVPEGHSFAGRFFNFRAALGLATAAGFLLIASIGLVSYSYRTIPGDSFYPVKILCEKIDLDYLTAENKKSDKHIELADERLDEVQKVAHSRHSIDKNALHSMHEHTEIALNDVEGISDNEEIDCLNRIQQLHRRQIDLLKRTRADFYAQNADEINQSIQLCNDRMNWVIQANEAVSQQANAGIIE